MLLDLQADLVARARADEFIGSVTVLDQRKGQIENEIAGALGLLTETAGKLGACVILLAPIGDVVYADAPGGPLEMEVTFRVLEDPVLNMDVAGGTLKSAEELAVRIVRVFQHYHPQGLAATLAAKKPTIVPVGDPMARVAYEVRFMTVEDGSDFDKVSTPALSVEEGAAPQTVTITCATAEAQIYYTLDGTHPWSGNGTLYTAPVAVEAAGILRAAAFKTGVVASDVAAGIFT